MHYDVIIVGNSAAALSAIKTLRAANKTITIALFDKEDEPAYSRVLTPYYIGFHTDRDHLYIVDRHFYAKNGIDAYLGKEVIKVDTNKKTIYTQDSVFTYNYLLIATGARAKQPSIVHNKVFTLRNIVDADILHKEFLHAMSVSALGAGLVSVPTLSHLPNSTKKHIIVSSDRVLSQVVDKEASYILEDAFSKKNVAIYKNDDIESIQDNSDGTIKLKLKSNHTIDCDFLLVGKGVEPNVEFLKGELEIDRGVLIDDRCATSADCVYACGDCAQGKDFVIGKKVIQGNWITAVEQAHIAAKNILGYNVVYDGSLKNNTTEVFGTDIAVLGYNRDDAPKTIEFYDKDRGFYRKIFLDETLNIIGATLINDTNDAGIYYNLIKTRAKASKILGINQFANYAKFLHSLDYK